MTAAIYVAAAAVFVALRVWFRRRRAGTREAKPATGFGPFSGSVGLVTAREIRQRVRGRVFRVGTVLILAAVGAAIIIPTLNKSTSHPQQIGVVGALPTPLRTAVGSAASSIGTAVHLVPEPDLPTATRDLKSGRIDVAIVNSRALVVQEAIGPDDSSTTAELVPVVAKNLGVVEAFESAKLSPLQASELTHAKALPVTSLQRGHSSAPRTVSPLGPILVFLMLTQYCTWTPIGVMEEKSSRVVEVLLATVRPVQLLAGKVLGIGLVALAQASLIVAFAVGLAKAVGADLPNGTGPVVLLCTLLWLLLGYAFYCWVYAAGGSMAERQDQIQSLALPLNVPIIFGYLMALTTAASGRPSTFFKVLAYLPPTAPFAMPILVSLGKVSWWQFAIAVALSIAGTVAIARLATNIYRRAILRTGKRVPLREIFARASA